MQLSQLCAGDPQQLPATIISQKAKIGGLGRSLFERLVKCGHQVAFTCVHNISDLVFDTNDIMLVLVHKTQILTLTNAKSQFCTRSLTLSFASKCEQHFWVALL